jgi:hypothetical protein
VGQVHVNVWGGQVCRPRNGNREQSDDHAGSPLHSVGVFGLDKKEADYDSSLDRDTRRLKSTFYEADVSNKVSYFFPQAED